MEQLWFGKYCPLDLLSSNNDVESYLAAHVKLDEKRFIKRIYKKSPYFVRFAKEAEILKGLNNGHIPRVCDIEEDESYYYIIEQYIAGKSLSEFCEEQKELSFSEILHLIFQVCSIIEYLHKCTPAVLHLDISADNIIISDREVFLVDFGNALLKDEKSDTYLFGTRRFSAPEQAKGSVDERTDIYSCGSLGRYLLGYFNGHSRLSAGLEAVCRRCCEENPKKRFETAEELKGELTKLLKTEERKKMEDEKIAKKPEKMITIGVAGAFRGAGATHTAIMLAGYFRRKINGKVAVAEASGRTDIKSMSRYGAGLSKDISSEEGFRIKGIHFFGAKSTGDLVKLRNKDFSCMILDMGTIEGGLPEEMLRCDYKVIVTSQAPWRDKYNERLRKELEKTGNARWMIFVNLQSAAGSRILRNSEIKQVSVDFCEDIFKISGKTQKHLKSLF